MHTTYIQHSVTYARAYELHGASLPVGIAIKFAASHSTTLAELRESGEPLVVTNGLVKTLELFQALGY